MNQAKNFKILILTPKPFCSYHKGKILLTEVFFTKNDIIINAV